MSQPQWITPQGNLGTIPEGVFYRISVRAEAGDRDIFYRLIAGELPPGIQVTANGSVEGVPLGLLKVQGVPLDVGTDVTSRFAIRAYTTRTLNGNLVVDRLADRTFTITVTGQDAPEFVTPAGNIGTYYDGTEVDIQIEFTDQDPEDEVEISLISGSLPPGVVLQRNGRIVGAIAPLIGPPGTALPGYSATPYDQYPYDYSTRSTSRNYQFTLEITDGKNSNIRTFEIFVYAKDDMTADTTSFTADNTFITADIVPTRTPVIITPQGSLGTVRADNFYAYKFDAIDFDGDPVEYTITLGGGQGYDETLFDETGIGFDRSALSLPPGIILNADTGWLSGYIPNLGAVEDSYRFAIRVRKKNNPSIISDFYYYTITIVGDIETEVIWLTDPNLGVIDNGSISTLSVEARNVAGIPLQYRLQSGSNSALPQGLELYPSGHIVGRVSFNTFALDGGTTTFDVTQATRFDTEPTTFDSQFSFTVNAFAPDTEQLTYQVSSIEVLDGGTNYRPFELSSITIELGGFGYDPMDPPTVTVAPPPDLPGNQPATLGTVTITSGAITAVEILDPGYGYTTSPAVTVTGGAGSGARLRAEIYQINIELSEPPETINAVRATAGSITVVNGKITAIAVGNPGRGYVTAPTVTITGGGGSGAEAVAQIIESTRSFSVSVFRRFTVRVNRVFNEPYETLYIKAMPPLEDRALLDTLFDDDGSTAALIPESALYRSDDPNFGRSRSVTYVHAFGLASASLDLYVESLGLNHYWRDLTLGPIRTAQALDPKGNVLYEVIYSEIIDNLVNNQGVSVGKSVAWPYAIDTDQGVITTVYPNSLDNMRDQVIDTVGQISPALPLWMTSKQTDRRVLGFVPAWVIAYIKPGESGRIAYELRKNLQFRLNVIDVEVDRYELDRSQTRNWDPDTNQWIPYPPQATTFDSTDRPSGLVFRGEVDYATNLGYSEINKRTLAYIAARGGIDGDVGRQLNDRLLIFKNQETFPFLTVDQAFTDWIYTYSETPFDESGTVYDESALIPVPQRLAIYRMSVNIENIVTLTLVQNCTVNDYVQITRGQTYVNQQLYLPNAPPPGSLVRTWTNIPQRPITPTIFDGNSTKFSSPADRWIATDRFDKYLVFPKRTILG